MDIHSYYHTKLIQSYIEGNTWYNKQTQLIYNTMKIKK